MTLAYEMPKTPAQLPLFLHINDVFLKKSPPFPSLPPTNYYFCLFTPPIIIIKMPASRLLDIRSEAEDSDHHGHRTHTSVLFLPMS